jgi:O-antigen/teichoic acid export membrane protein
MSVKKHSIMNLVGSFLPLLIMLFTVPIYLKLIGTERYGTMAILWSMMGYFGFVNLGLGRAVAQRIPTAEGNTALKRSNLVWTALSVTFCLGLFAGLLLWISADFILTHWVEMTPRNFREVKSAVPWLIIVMPLIFSGAVLSGALHGRQQFLVMNVFLIVGSALSQLIPLGMAMFGYTGLDWLVPAAISARVITFAINFYYCRHNLPLRRRPTFRMTIIKPLLSFGGWVSLDSIFSPLLGVVDRMIIATMAGLTAVTHYTIPYNLTSNLSKFSSSYSSALFPKMSSEHNQDKHEILYERLNALVLFTAPIFITASYFIKWFLTLWIGAEFSINAAPVALTLLLGIFFNSLSILFYNYIQAQNRPDYIVKCYLVQLPIYFLMLYFFIAHFGVIGAAIATSLRMAIGLCFLILFFKSTLKFFVAISISASPVIIAVLINIYSTQNTVGLYLLGAINILVSIYLAWLYKKKLCLMLLSFIVGKTFLK